MSLAVLLMLVAGGEEAGVVALSNSGAYRIAIEPANATTTYSLGANGVVTSPSNPDSFWISPQVGMGLFEVLATLNSGTLASGTIGAWLQLNTTRSWTVTQNTGAGLKTANITLQIRRIGDVTVLASAVISITAEVASA